MESLLGLSLDLELGSSARTWSLALMLPGAQQVPAVTSLGWGTDGGHREAGPWSSSAQELHLEDEGTRRQGVPVGLPGSGHFGTPEPHPVKASTAVGVFLLKKQAL